ncbi:MAG: SPOR domain-containing protein [Gammaproteobacteria bacterium]|jgi:hypothetical protein|nr:SPOR domain-containing protein [Gammaproteobacteria bacterium]MBT3860959.1 SPOR domain-containing protein [Gammaproteobacteria bacterium]MBT3987186.1 SPOR domain-containing protein [Gammaproteobacteria bacterium]MBT4255494.1 SPOR domain-containing protein [Gammaproteobacteria bacterium]MBT4581173.1 SPOR domain-containing protein [Gammaproteobacteria bacterium]
MRYIAIFLLLANIAYFAWLYYQPYQTVELSRVESRDLLNSGLVLVSEYNEQLAEITPICEMISSFATVDEARSFIAEVADTEYSAQLRLTGESLPSLYRLFLPPSESREEATRVLDSLSEALSLAEIEIESYPVTRGLLANAIALGVYEDMDIAIQTGEQLIGIGYSPEIEEIPRSSGDIGVILRATNRSRTETAPWLELTVDRPNLTRQENLCETIAQGAQFP